MTVTNFKSFRGTQKVGPFNSFTSIVGPNGAGKSCVLKAMSFCLALKGPDFTKENLASIRNKEAKASDLVSVEMVFHTRLHDNVYLKRTMGAKDRDEDYQVNGKSMTKTKYREFITDQKIDVHAGIFMFGQGFSDTLIMKSPQELRFMFEVVSNAYEFKQECEELEQEIKKHQEEFDKLTEDLKNLNKQKKLVANQLTNSDHYNKISSTYDRLETDQLLSCLLELDLKVKNANTQIMSLVDKIKDSNVMHDKLAKELKSNLEKRAEAKESSDVAEQELNRKQHELAFAGERRLKAENKKKEISSLQKSLESSLATLNSRMREVMKDKEAIQREIETAEQEITKLGTSGKLSPDLETHYQALVKSTLSVQLENPEESEAKSEEKRVAVLHDRVQREHDLAAKTARDLEVSLKLQESKLEAKQRTLQSEQAALKANEREYRGLQDRLANVEQQKRAIKDKQSTIAELSVAIDNLRHKLGEQHHQDELVRKLNDNVEGFRGELGSLIKPVHERYAVALHLALGKARHYLVVKNEKAAALANEILKEKFMTRTVVVLENVPIIKSSEIQAFRADIGQLGAAAYDIAEFEKADKDIEPCLRYFLKGKAVCETMEKAHKLRAQQGRKAHIITVAGEQLRDTYMTSIGDAELIAQDQATKMAVNLKIEELRQRKETLEEELKATAGVDDVQNADLLRDRIASLVTTIKQLQIEIESLEAGKVKLKRDLETRESERRAKEVDLQDIGKQLGKVRQRLDKFRADRKELLREKVLEYATKNKVKDKNSLVEAFLDKIEATVDKELNLRQVIANKRRQITDLGLQDIQDKVNAAKSNHDNYESLGRSNEKELTEITKQCEQLRSEIEAADGRKKQTKADYLKYIENETKLRARLREVSDEIDVYKASIRNFEIEFQSSMRRKTQLIEDKSLEGITIPLLRGEAPEAIKTTAKRLGEQSTVNVDYSTLVERVKSGEGGIIREEAEFEDEDEESSNALNMFTLSSVVEIRKYLTAEFEKSVKELNSLSTKFVTDDTIDREKRKLSELVEKITAVKNKVDECKDAKTFRENELNKFKGLRNSRFMDLFNIVSVRIKDVYRRLNRNDTADAYLTLESPNDPCAGGVIFNPTPPNKKYIFDAASLSGGEKTLASLALYFAINDVVKSPFLLLDEADSALDKYNVALVQAYLKGLSKSRQVITISHNSWFIRRSSMLLGITKLPALKGSSCFSFDLDHYRNALSEEIEA